jgi:hypothetical protein
MENVTVAIKTSRFPGMSDDVVGVEIKTLANGRIWTDCTTFPRTIADSTLDVILDHAVISFKAYIKHELRGEKK